MLIRKATKEELIKTNPEKILENNYSEAILSKITPFWSILDVVDFSGTRMTKLLT